MFKLPSCGICHGANHFKITYQHIETSAINPVYYPQMFALIRSLKENWSYIYFCEPKVTTFNTGPERSNDVNIIRAAAYYYKYITYIRMYITHYYKYMQYKYTWQQKEGLEELPTEPLLQTATQITHKINR